MSDKNRKPESVQEESTIFSSHKSAADLRREQKEKRRLERQRLADELAAQSSETRIVTRVMVIILALIVVGCAVAVYLQARPDKNSGKEIASNSNHFTDFDALPELSQEGIKAVVTEAYYTQDGSLAVSLKLSNGMDTPQAVDSFSFSLLNSSGDELASGHQADDWDASLVVPAGGYEELTLYVPPEDVKIKNDLLSTLSFEITITSIPAEETTTD